MASSNATSEPRSVFGWWKPAATEVELKRLEREVAEGREREEGLRKELEKVVKRLRVAEEAEEWLCVQLGELEAESAECDGAYRERIRELTRELERVKSIINMPPSSSF